MSVETYNRYKTRRERVTPPENPNTEAPKKKESDIPKKTHPTRDAHEDLHSIDESIKYQQALEQAWLISERDLKKYSHGELSQKAKEELPYVISRLVNKLHSYNTVEERQIKQVSEYQNKEEFNRQQKREEAYLKILNNLLSFATKHEVKIFDEDINKLKNNINGRSVLSGHPLVDIVTSIIENDSAQNLMQFLLKAEKENNLSKWVKAIEKKEKSFDQLLKKLQQPISEPMDELNLKNRVILLAKISKNCFYEQNKGEIFLAALNIIRRRYRINFHSALLLIKFLHASRS